MRQKSEPLLTLVSSYRKTTQAVFGYVWNLFAFSLDVCDVRVCSALLQLGEDGHERLVLHYSAKLQK